MMLRLVKLLIPTRLVRLLGFPELVEFTWLVRLLRLLRLVRLVNLVILV